MPETIADSMQSSSDESRKAKIWIAIGFALLTLAFARYLSLFRAALDRAGVFDFFFYEMLPIALAHTALLLLLILVFKARARGILIFWMISAVILASFGSWKSFAALFLVLAFGFIIARAGKLPARYLLPPASQNWGISLAFGLLALSAVGAFLAWLHLFTWWILAILVLIGLLPDLRSPTSTLRADFRSGWEHYQSNWNVPLALTLQALFLLGVHAYVAALAPETNSDAVRFYWPYIRLLRHYWGFFNAQQQWSYIIPQGGVTYAAAVLSMLGSQAVRLSMLLALASLVGMLGGRRIEPGRNGRYALAVVVASSPVVMWVSGSLMLDTFACVAILVFALMCVEGSQPGSLKFWVGIGLCASAAWAAKYTSLVYAIPLLSYASFRSFRTRGLMQTLRGMALAAVFFLGALSPWLANSYHQSGNPVFPFLLKVFPSTLWPRGVESINLTGFHLPAGWRGWLLWPIDLTYHTSRFVEGYDGSLGIVLIALLILGIAVIHKGSAGSRVLIVAGIIGAAILWTRTSYLRYWLPSLWLLAMAGGDVLERRIRSERLHWVFGIAAFVIMIPQVLFIMLNCWPSSQGWPWNVFIQRIGWQTYLGDDFRGISNELEKSNALGRGWPKIWFTGIESIAHLNVQPMDATTWELKFHASGPRSKIKYLSSAGSSFWAVKDDDEAAFWFKAEGISPFFWNEARLVARYKTLAVYRMPSAEEALREFDSRATPGTDLALNGDFKVVKGGWPEFWIPEGEVRLTSPSTGAVQGKLCLLLMPNTRVREGVALPPGLKNLEIEIGARTTTGGQQSPLSLQYFVTGFDKDPATASLEEQLATERAIWSQSESFMIGGAWQQYRVVRAVPKQSQTLFVYIGVPEGGGEVWIDSVHIYSR